jgi:uncharacterized phiE125 gp8 family phage protein
MRAYTNDPLQSPANEQSLADWLRLDDATDPLLRSCIILATQIAVDYLQRDLLARDWVVSYEQWPEAVTPRHGVSQHYSKLLNRIEMPYAQLISVDTVTVYGEAVTEYRAADTLPATIKFTGWPVITSTVDEPAIVITYRAGFGELPTDVPEAIRSAIVMIAAYIYTHRGACEALEAIKMSGAAILLQPWRVRAGVSL